MIVLRSILFNFFFYVNLIGLMILGLPTMLAGPRGVIGLARLWGRTSLWLLRVICRLDVEYRGLENIPPDGFIIAPKHQSIWETFALLPLFSNFTFILKRELTWIPVFGWYLHVARQIAINRAAGSAALSEATARAGAELRAGRNVFIFPEGTRRPAGAAPAYKFGIGAIYQATEVKCLPIALNSGLFWPRRSFLRQPGKVLVQILPPIEPGLEAQELVDRIAEKIESATNALIAESLAENGLLAQNLVR
jgi:1-acyl-sn-glycerol-3-phosphate acyltransferase